MHEINLFAFGFRPSWKHSSAPLYRKIAWASRAGFRRAFHKHNFGDYFSLLLLRRIALNKVGLADIDTHGKLLAVGSILWALRDSDSIWGTGARDAERIPYRKDVRVLAVRGPLTHRVLLDAGVISRNTDSNTSFFDPGIFISLLVDETQRARLDTDIDALVIPHWADLKSPEILRAAGLGNERIVIASPFLHPKRIASLIMRSKRVLASSLHAIIFAEALGVNVTPFRLPTSKEPVFKYEDYFEGTGRPLPPFARSIAKALDMNPISFRGYSPSTLRKHLLTFPYELAPAALAKAERLISDNI